MNVTDGSYELGPQRGALLVHTTRTGFGSKAGHDLTTRSPAWHGSATIDLGEPGRSEIEKTLRGKILRADRHPALTFASTAT